MAELIAKHGFFPRDFVKSDGQESIDTPIGMERRFDRNGWLNPGPLKGTPLLLVQTSVECDEWDCKLPTDALEEIDLWRDMQFEQLEQLDQIGWDE
ncbi:hypothetical protein DYI24_19885 [Rhodopseudomonas sp. BR0C11]|uniref:hypothetical protein n=1 Tax=Rhodopseudomonas sp. BR0C11 TaxID=2269370 RepID=UPI0013DF9E85|nr:hypothetical protein [Rhodopseudomonas sp. BR0C11]NEV79295.1 hypothetical protein [Rhodopseudomonas sp. BR0C11]